MHPTAGQLAVLLLSIAFFAVGGMISFARIWWPKPGLRLAAKSCFYFGVCSTLAVLVWHSVYRGRWLPVGDNFDALIWLGLLLALVVLYVQRRRPIGSLDWFIMPIVVLLLIGAVYFGNADFHPYVNTTWSWVHRATAYIGAAAFAIAAACGTMYVLASQRLRRKQPTGPWLGSLERLERMMMTSVTLGFALLAVATVTGFIGLYEGERVGPAKMTLAIGALAVYAIILHAPVNPRFRGRKVAFLSIFGFVLMIGALLVVQFLPGGRS